MRVPLSALSADVVTRLIQEYITREGTFVGEGDAPSLDEDVARVRGQLKSGEVVITFDEETETVTLLTRQQAEDAGV